MAVVLGKPITTLMAAESLDLPDDLAKRELEEPPRKRAEEDAPTPSSVIRVGYDVAYRHFPRIRNLENRGAKLEDYHVVRETHAEIMEAMDRIPRWCRRDNPELRFDELPTCHWLPAARQALTSGIYFVLLSLHRPYMFSARESRTEALKAAEMVLTTQDQLFHLSDPTQYLSFNMVYPLFDAIVISSAILVLFPNENRDLRSQLMEKVRWGNDLLIKVGEHNSMARSAASVARTLLSRLNGYREHSSRHSNRNRDHSESKSLESGAFDLHAVQKGSSTGVMAGGGGVSHYPEPSPSASVQMLTTTSTFPDFDFENLLPPRPVGDLYYHDVHTQIPDPLLGADYSTEVAQFEGDLSDGSFWSFLNDFGHV